MNKLPLEGIRVVDFSWMAAGPWSTRQLAIMGADVIKIESNRRLDLLRTTSPWADGIPGVNRGGGFNVWSDSRKSCTINLADSRGSELACRLIKKSDVVVESFGFGTLEKLGLGYSKLKQLRPEIIMISVSGFGRTGPEKAYTAYGRVLQAESGLSSLVRYPGGHARGMRVQWSDFITGYTAAYAILLALFHRMRTGEGQYIDTSLFEVTSLGLVESIMDYQMNGRDDSNVGNQSSTNCPHNCFQCTGEDKWIAISVKPEMWSAFIQTIGFPAWAADEKFADLEGRLQNRAELERLIEAWTIHFTSHGAMEILQNGGVAAGASIDVEELIYDPGLSERGALVEIEHPLLGKRHTPGIPWRSSGIDQPKYGPAPMLGEHNDYVFNHLLGLSPDEVEELKAGGVIN